MWYTAKLCIWNFQIVPFVCSSCLYFQMLFLCSPCLCLLMSFLCAGVLYFQMSFLCTCVLLRADWNIQRGLNRWYRFAEFNLHMRYYSICSLNASNLPVAFASIVDCTSGLKCSSWWPTCMDILYNSHFTHNAVLFAFTNCPNQFPSYVFQACIHVLEYSAQYQMRTLCWISLPHVMLLYSVMYCHGMISSLILTWLLICERQYVMVGGFHFHIKSCWKAHLLNRFC